MPIYTKKGDSGQTSTLISRLSKDSPLIEALGVLDEASCFLGLAISFTGNKKIIDHLRKIQIDLSQISAILAGADLNFEKTRIKWLEEEIAGLESKFFPLKGFLLPGKNKSSAFLHTARAIVRRAERGLVRLNKKVKINSQILGYMNRLSDFLFLLARLHKQSKKPSSLL